MCLPNFTDFADTNAIEASAAVAERLGWEAVWTTDHVLVDKSEAAADYEVSKVFQSYFVNFIKTGNPNGSGLPEWPAYRADDNYRIMRIDVKSGSQPEPHRDRYLALDAATSR